MKKYGKLLLIPALTLGLSITQVSAANTKTVDSLYSDLKSYYSSLKTYDQYDDVFAMEALGVESDNKTGKDIEFNDGAGQVAKAILYYSLKGQDPKKVNVNGKTINYVSKLEYLINTDGSVKGTYSSYEMSTDSWVLGALYAVNSSKTNTVLNYVNKLVKTSTFSSSYEWGGVTYSSEDIDSAGLTLELLTLLKGDTSSVVRYINSHKITNSNNNTVFTTDGYTGNPDSQAAAIEGLSVYNKTALNNGTYTLSNAGSIFNGLLDYYKGVQNKVPTFDAYDSDYAKRDVARGIGIYKNGSIFKKAKTDYEATLKKNLKVGKVTGVKVTKKSKALKVTWKKASNAKKYQVAYKRYGKKYKWHYKTVSSKTYTIKKLKKNKKYYVKVRAINGSKKGAWSTKKLVKVK